MFCGIRRARDRDGRGICGSLRDCISVGENEMKNWQVIALTLLLIGCAFGFALIGTLASVAEENQIAVMEGSEQGIER